jgi:transposase
VDHNDNGPNGRHYRPSAAPPARKPGRARVPDRACLTGIVFVLKTGIQWEYLPQEMGCGSGMTCWRRLRDWPRRNEAPQAVRAVAARLWALERGCGPSSAAGGRGPG